MPPTPTAGRRPSAGTWSLIHAERAALAADLAELTGQRSRCVTGSPFMRCSHI